jgi:hypothetical protein
LSHVRNRQLRSVRRDRSGGTAWRETGGSLSFRLSAAAGPVAAAARHSGRAAVEAALRFFFAPRSRADGTVRMGVVFRGHLAERAR